MLQQIDLNLDHALHVLTQCADVKKRNNLMMLVNKMKKKVSLHGEELIHNNQDIYLWEISVQILNQLKSAQETDPDFQFDFDGLEE